MQLKLTWLGLALILVTTCIVYSFGLHGPFLLDDTQNLSMAQIPSMHWQEIWQTIWSNDSGPLRRPVSILSFILTEAWLGSSPFDYKIVNLGLHLICGLVLFWVSCLILGRLLNKDKKQVQFYALFITSLWLLHPLQVSTVLYAVQRMAILSNLFMLIGIGVYLTLRTSQSSKAQVPLSITLVTVWFLALLSKENGLLLPFYLLAFECVYVSSHPQSSKKALKGCAALCMSIVLAGFAFYIYKWSAYTIRFEEKGFTRLGYLVHQSQVLCFYLKQILMPKLSAMGLYHEDFLQKSAWPVWVCLPLLLSMMIGALLAARRFPVIAFGLAWFFISHGVESTVLPLEPVFEHRNYLAVAGILIALIGVLEVARKTKALKQGLWVLPTLVVLIYVPMTWARVDSWSSTYKFLVTAQHYHPLSARTHIEWANYLFAQGDFLSAKQSLEKAQALDANNSGPIVHELVTLCFIEGPKDNYLQKTKQALATKKITPYTVLTLDALVQNIFNQQCKTLSAKEVLPLLDTALANRLIAQKPKYQANLHHLKAGLLVVQSDWQAAIESLDLAYELNNAGLG